MRRARNRASRICVTSRGLVYPSASRENRTSRRVPRVHEQMAETSNIIILRPGKFQQFQRRFRMRKASQVTAVDIDGATLRIVQADIRGERKTITRVAAVPLNIPTEDRPDPEALGKAVRAALDSARIKPGFVVMGIPRAQVILRTLLLPASDDLSELASMVHLQIGKDLPFRKDDAVIDFRVRPQKRPSTDATPAGDSPEPDPTPTLPKIEALVAVAQREVVEFYRGVASAANFKLSGL